MAILASLLSALEATGYIQLTLGETSQYDSELAHQYFFFKCLFLIVPRRSLTNSTIKVFMLLACHG